MLVHYGGYPCDIDEFYALASDKNLSIIEDCAHACGATYKGKKIGSHGDIHAFSFHPVKNLPMAEGGALTVRSEDYDRRLRRLRWLGISTETYHRHEPGGIRWLYDVTELGYRYYMNDVQAAIGLVQLDWLEGENNRRKEIAAQYIEQLSNVPGIQLLKYKDDRTSSYHLFSLLAEQRDSLVEKLQANGVDFGVHYIRNDHFSIYEEGELPNTESFWRREISLPMHVVLKDEQIYYITNIIRKGW